MGDVHSRRLQLGSQIPRQEWEGDGGQDVAFFGIYTSDLLIGSQTIS